jgi:hypothetical protein
LKVTQALVVARLEQPRRGRVAMEATLVSGLGAPQESAVVQVVAKSSVLQALGYSPEPEWVRAQLEVLEPGVVQPEVLVEAPKVELLEVGVLWRVRQLALIVVVVELK